MDKIEILKETLIKKAEKNDNFTKIKNQINSIIQEIIEFFNNRTKSRNLNNLANLLADENKSIILPDNNESKDLYSMVNYITQNEEIINKNNKIAVLDSFNIGNISKSYLKEKNDLFKVAVDNKISIDKNTQKRFQKKQSDENIFISATLKEYLLYFKKSINNLTSKITAKKQDKCLFKCVSEPQLKKVLYQPNIAFIKNMRNSRNENIFKTVENNPKSRNQSKLNTKYNTQTNTFGTAISKEKDILKEISSGSNKNIIDSFEFSLRDPNFFNKMDNTIILKNNLKFQQNNASGKKENLNINENSKMKTSVIKISKISLIQHSKQNKSLYKISNNKEIKNNMSSSKSNVLINFKIGIGNNDESSYYKDKKFQKNLTYFSHQFFDEKVLEIIEEKNK